MKDWKLLVSSVLIIVSFFVWILFWKQLDNNKIDEIKNENKYININIKKLKIDIENQNKNIFISINWKPINEADLSLENICK